MKFDDSPMKCNEHAPFVDPHVKSHQMLTHSSSLQLFHLNVLKEHIPKT